MIDTSQSYRLADNISFSETDNEMVLLNLDTGSYFGLNAVGVEIINSIEKRESFTGIVKKLSKKYEVDTAVIKKDVTDLMQQLLDNKLILTE